MSTDIQTLYTKFRKYFKITCVDKFSRKCYRNNVKKVFSLLLWAHKV